MLNSVVVFLHHIAGRLYINSISGASNTSHKKYDSQHYAHISPLMIILCCFPGFFLSPLVCVRNPCISVF